MHPPIFVRELSDPERAQLQVSLRAPSAFTLRRAQILLASALQRIPWLIAPEKPPHQGGGTKGWVSRKPMVSM